jgi:DNA-binding transcriptional MerR regulator/methylmalonyl-CoA mutase cobalamin-binding subunit
LSAERREEGERADECRHSIRVVAGRTGLTPDAIRAWERRHGAVAPGRSDSRRRLYSDRDVERLLLLRRAIAAGRRIGDVAGLDDGALREMVASDERAQAEVRAALASAPARVGRAGSGDRLAACMEAVEALDAAALQAALSEAAVQLSATRLLDELLMPLLREIGERWRAGRLRPAHEHFATAMLRSFLGNLPVSFTSSEQAPLAIVTTPRGQLHELGALGAAITAELDGWRVLYLGANLPCEEIALAARDKGARLVALSIVYPPDDAQLGEELRRLRRLLPDDVVALAGGASTAAYAEALADLGAVKVADFAALREELQRLRGRTG